MKQKSNEWYQARLGRFTASQCADLMGKVAKTDSINLSFFQSQTARNYILEKVAETLTGNREELSSKEMDWGKQLEPDALEYFELSKDLKVEEIGIIKSDSNGSISCSPDGLVSEDKGIEIKCPFNSRNHILHMMVGDAESLKKINARFYWQIQMCLMLSKRKSWYFVSYDPRFEGKFRMQIAEIERNKEDIELLSVRLEKACEIKQSILKQISY